MKSSKSYHDFRSRNSQQQTSNDGTSAKNELDKSGSNSLKSVLSALSLSIKSWKPGSSTRSSKKRTPQQDTTELPEEMQDEERLQRCLQDAGRSVDGVGGVEVWVLDRSDGSGTRLVQPPGGFWCSKYFVAEDYEALARINDKSRDDYVPAPPLMPGTGLAGALWNEQRNTVDEASKKQNFGYYNAKAMSPLKTMTPKLSFASSLSSSSASSSVKSFQSMTNLNADYRNTMYHNTNLRKMHSIANEHGLTWRDIRSVTVDPYMPTFLRLELMEAAGFTKCAGIHFDIQGTRGIVLFLANDQVRVSRLNFPDNVAYIM
jgi:hypothetical protein